VPWNAKLLATRAPALAAALLTQLENERLVARFLDSYAEEAKRPGLKAHVERYRELLATIGRESLLAMAAEADRLLLRSLARHGGQAQPRAGRSAAPALAESFRRALVTSLGESLAWRPEEREEFARDLDLYLRLDARSDARKPRRAAPPYGPFVDRCALLLDPPMLPQARRAAADYLPQLEAHAARAFRRAFRSGEAKRTAPRPAR
jgi:hypothetical protein